MYKMITEEEKDIIISHIETQLEEIEFNLDHEEEYTFLKKIAEETRLLSNFYLIIKVHKIDLGSRGISPAPGTHLESTARWRDVQLQHQILFLPSLVESETNVVIDMSILGKVNKYMVAFRSDVVKMYPNIAPMDSHQTIL